MCRLGLKSVDFSVDPSRLRYSATCRADLGDEDHPINACKVGFDPERWRATTSYTVRPPRDAGLGSVVRPTTYSGRHFQCVIAGTSGASEPAWNTTIGGTTNDGSVVWIAIEARTRPSAVVAVGNPRALFTAGTELNGLADRFFPFGLVTWITSWTIGGTLLLCLPHSGGQPAWPPAAHVYGRRRR